MRILLSVFIFIGLSVTTNIGQVPFRDATQEVLGDERLNSTHCIGFEDLNGDGREDLFLLDEGKVLKTFIQGKPNQTFDYKQHLTVSQSGDWSVLSGDLNNDGIPEIISNSTRFSRFLGFNGSTYTTSFITPESQVFSQNSNLVDLNNDGFLDFFLCNDDGESPTFINDGAGNMIKTQIIDFQTSPSDDMSGNYSSIFTDVDGDGDVDLYIGKCKAGIDDPTDPRRVNTLYINNGDGTFSERAADFGLANGAQTWSVDAGDVDNDGDVDFIIANHMSPHDLMLNDGNGYFERYAMLPEGYETFAYQSFFCDFDNNGWLDIFITDPADSYILFNDEMSFTRRDLPGDIIKAFSGATGDLNSDGFPDLYLSYAFSFQTPSSIEDVVLLNEGNTNNYLNIHLTGTTSNRDAIGANITIYNGDEIKFREIIAGKSYGIMNSTVAHFGLGTWTSLDSIAVKWPSGAETIVRDIPQINTWISITEDGCVTSIYDLPDLQLCGDNEVEVSVPDGVDNILWSTGEVVPTISIIDAGVYSVEFEENGCLRRSSFFAVAEEEVLEPEEILSTKAIVACRGDVVELESHPGVDYFWSTGEDTQTIEVRESGIYNVVLSTNCDTYVSEDLSVIFAESDTANVEGDTILIGERAILSSGTENTNWYQNKNDLLPIAQGLEFETPELFEDQTYFVGIPSEGFGFNGSLMDVVPLNNVGDSLYKENEFVEFQVFSELTIFSLKVRTQRAGIRKVLILQEGIVVDSIDIDLSVGVNTIPLNRVFAAGKYMIGTDAQVNLENLGTEHPQLSYATIYSDKDKMIDGFLHIEDSAIYVGVSPYFFDWEVYYGAYRCEPRVPVRVVVDDFVATEDFGALTKVYPNPTSGQLYMESVYNGPFTVEVTDIAGNRIEQVLSIYQNRSTIEMPRSAGLYFVKITSQGRSETFKVVVGR